jgi:HK97 family phage prohead protease
VSGRAWSTFVVKSADDEQRILTGIASTPSTDRVGDIVEPMGAQFKLPLPMLWQHDSSAPVGQVTQATPTKDGIPVTISLAKTDEPGTLKDRLDEAWQSIRLGLVRGLSIGFAPVEYSYLEDTGGIRFSKWTWLELSAVTIPANTDASIATIKRYDESRQQRQTKSRWPFREMTWAKTTPERFAAEIGKYVLDSVGDVLVAGLASRDAKIKSLHDEITRLQAEHKYFGVWTAGSYMEHNSVTHKGSLWIALADTEGEPGTTEDWQLAVKRGRDAR